MTGTLAAGPSAAAPAAPAMSPVVRRVAFVAGSLLGIALLAFLWMTTEHTLVEERLVNPLPSSAPFDSDGLPRAIDPVWGVSNWPLVLTAIFVTVPSLSILAVIVRSVRTRQISHQIVVFLVIAAMASLDTYGAWASFTIYNPQFAHFPTTWPWAGLSPSVQPVFTIIGYPFFYFTPGLLTLAIFKRLWNRAGDGGFAKRHPLWSLWALGFAVMVCFDVPLELLSMRVDMYFYSEYMAPAIRWGYAVLPFMEVLVASTMTGIIAVLLWERPDGWTVMRSGAERYQRVFDRMRIRGRMREYVVGLTIGWTALFLLFSLWGGLRVVRPHETFVGPWHYGEMRTYDPYHRLEDAGKPGPYFGDIWQDQDDFADDGGEPCADGDAAAAVGTCPQVPG